MSELERNRGMQAIEREHFIKTGRRNMCMKTRSKGDTLDLPSPFNFFIKKIFFLTMQHVN